jgi:hypothetical protein
VRRIASFIPDKERGEEAGDFLEGMEELHESDEGSSDEDEEEQEDSDDEDEDEDI